MSNKTNTHLELENEKNPATVVVNNKDYQTTVITVENGEGEEIHSLEVEDWNHQPELEVIK